MGTIIPTGFANVRFVFACAGVNDPMGFSIGVESQLGSPASTIGTQMSALFDDNIWDGGANAGSDWTWLSTETTLETESGPVSAVKAESSGGDITAPTVPPNCCMLISKITGLGGRKNRGRLYLIGGLVFESEVSSAGTFAGGTVIAHADKWNNLLIEAAVAQLDLVLFHSSPADPPTPITGFQPASVIGTQRRRLR